MTQSTINDAVNKAKKQIRQAILAGDFVYRHYHELYQLSNGFYWAKNIRQYLAYGHMQTKLVRIPVWAIEFIPEIVNLQRSKTDQTMLGYTKEILTDSAKLASYFTQNAAHLVKEFIYSDYKNTLEVAKFSWAMRKHSALVLDLLDNQLTDTLYLTAYWKAHPNEYEQFGKNEQCAWVFIPKDLEQEIYSFIEPQYYKNVEAKRYELISNKASLDKCKKEIMLAVDGLDQELIVQEALYVRLKQVELSEMDDKSIDAHTQKMIEVELKINQIKAKRLDLTKVLWAVKGGVRPYQSAFQYYFSAQKSLEKLKKIYANEQAGRIQAVEASIESLYQGIETKGEVQQKLIDLLAHEQLVLDKISSSFITRQTILKEIQQLSSNHWQQLTPIQEKLSEQFHKDNPLDYFNNFKEALLKAADNGCELSQVEVALFLIGLKPYLVPSNFIEKDIDKAIKILDDVIYHTRDNLAQDRAKVALAMANIINNPNGDITDSLSILAKNSLIARDLVSHQWAKNFTSSEFIENLPVSQRHQFISYQKKVQVLYERATDLKLKMQARRDLVNAKAFLAKLPWYRRLWNFIVHPIKSMVIWFKSPTDFSEILKQAESDVGNITKDKLKKIPGMYLTTLLNNLASELDRASNFAQEKYFILETLHFDEAPKEQVDKAYKIATDAFGKCFDIYDKHQLVKSEINNRAKRVIDKSNNATSLIFTEFYKRTKNEVKSNYESMPLIALQKEYLKLWEDHIKAYHNRKMCKKAYDEISEVKSDWEKYNQTKGVQKLLMTKPKVDLPDEDDLKAHNIRYLAAEELFRKTLCQAKVAYKIFIDRNTQDYRSLSKIPLPTLIEKMQKVEEEIQEKYKIQLHHQQEIDMLTTPLANYFGVPSSELAVAHKNLILAKGVTEATLARAQYGYDILKVRALQEASVLSIEALKSYGEELYKEHTIHYENYAEKLESYNGLIAQKNSWFGMLYMAKVPTESEILEAKAKVNAAKFLSDRTKDIADSVNNVYQQAIRVHLSDTSEDERLLSEMDLTALGNHVNQLKRILNDESQLHQICRNNLATIKGIDKVPASEEAYLKRDIQHAENAVKFVDNVEEVVQKALNLAQGVYFKKLGKTPLNNPAFNLISIEDLKLFHKKFEEASRKLPPEELRFNKRDLQQLIEARQNDRANGVNIGRKRN